MFNGERDEFIAGCESLDEGILVPSFLPRLSRNRVAAIFAWCDNLLDIAVGLTFNLLLISGLLVPIYLLTIPVCQLVYISETHGCRTCNRFEVYRDYLDQLA